MARLGTITRIARPFEGSYGVSLTVAILALVPYIVVSTASVLYEGQVMHALGVNRTGIAIITGVSEAGYAFGALLGGDIAQRFPQRPAFLMAEGLFIIGALTAAAAGDAVAYGAGMSLLGLSTGLMLVLALPPVIQHFPPERLPITAAAVNIGFFGAATAGPLFGGAVAAGEVWRWFDGGLAAIGVAVFGLALMTLPDQEPPNRGLPFDRLGIALGFAATSLPFWASGELAGHGFAAPLFIAPLAAGGCCFLALLLTEYHEAEPLSPVKLMWSTYPVIGTLVAMIGGGGFVTFLMLAIELLRQGGGAPLGIGLAFWPQVPGVLVTAVIMGALLRTRFLPLLILAGMLTLLAGGALLLAVAPRQPGGTMLAAAGLLGLGAGATVSPGLYLAAFALPSRMVGRTFALVELVRSVADYILAPVMRQVARVASGGAMTADGIRYAIAVTLLIVAAATLLGLGLYLIGRGGLPRPDIGEWLAGDETAVRSPLLAAALRRRARR